MKAIKITGLLLENGFMNFSSGYIATDLNGNGLADSSNMILLGNNSANFVSSLTP
jgi:hypothetical protein